MRDIFNLKKGDPLLVRSSYYSSWKLGKFESYFTCIGLPVWCVTVGGKRQMYTLVKLPHKTFWRDLEYQRAKQRTLTKVWCIGKSSGSNMKAWHFDVPFSEIVEFFVREDGCFGRYKDCWHLEEDFLENWHIFETKELAFEFHRREITKIGKRLDKLNEHFERQSKVSEDYWLMETNIEDVL